MSEEKATLTKEDLAFLVKAQYASLLVADWLRDDIIELGKSVFAKIPIDKIDEKKFQRLLPNLVKTAEDLGLRLREKVAEWALPLTKALESANADLQTANASLKTRLAALEKELQTLKTRHEQYVSSHPDVPKPAVSTSTTTEPVPAPQATPIPQAAPAPLEERPAPTEKTNG